MRKDIEIPKVSDVHVAAVKQFNEDLEIEEWNAYIINTKNEPLELVLIVSKGYKGSKKTSKMRHKLELLPAKSFAKVEFMEDSLLVITNQFDVTFFVDGTLYERTFIFPAGQIADKNQEILPLMGDHGVLAE
ncbi:MAG TPA: hypothetical protein ENH91_13955 [Leeuwenhoekiella sp.]|nr:hypothetical protein [Leeuwenhoekiella sp.]